MRLLHVTGFARTTFQNGGVERVMDGWFCLRLKMTASVLRLS
jgi:hypothetical protein